MGIKLPAPPAADADATAEVAAHNADTTAVHGIADTGVLVTDADLTSALAGIEVIGTTYVNIDHPDHGGDAQAAIDSITAGTIYVPGAASARALADTITLPDKISILGDGPQASAFDVGTSLGSGTYAIDAYPSGTGVYHDNTIAGIGLRGPAYGDALVRGTAGTDMHGIKVGRRTVGDRLNIQGFNYGWSFGADHAWLRHSTIISNHHNVVWITSASRWADHSIISCDLSSASMSSLSVEDGTFIDSSVIIDTHLAGAPYGVYSFPDRVETRFLSNTVFLDCAFEYFGNAMIYSADTSEALTNVYFIGGSFASQLDASKIAATTYNYCVDVGTISNLVVDNPGFFPTQNPALAWIHSRGNSIAGVRFRHLSTAALGAAASGKPILSFANGTGAAVNSTWANQEATGRFMRSTSALTAGQLAKVTGRETCDLYGTADGATGVAAAGLAKHACGANENVALVTGGYAGSIGIAGAAVTAGRLLKPDTGTAGRLIHATSGTDGPVCAVAMSSQASAGSTFQVEMRSGGWNP